MPTVFSPPQITQAYLARFQIEAEAVARLKHHNFVQIYEVGTDEGLPFLALEYCDGGSLEDRVTLSLLSPREAAELRRVLRGEPITARAATPLEQLVSWSRRNPLPTTIAVGAVVMLALLAGAMAWTTYRNYRTIEAIQQREMRVEDLRGRILYLDEVLTNSCSLAAVTGEPRWEQRYRKHLPELDTAILQTIELNRLA